MGSPPTSAVDGNRGAPEPQPPGVKRRQQLMRGEIDR